MKLVSWILSQLYTPEAKKKTAFVLSTSKRAKASHLSKNSHVKAVYSSQSSTAFLETPWHLPQRWARRDDVVRMTLPEAGTSFCVIGKHASFWLWVIDSSYTFCLAGHREQSWIISQTCRISQGDRGIQANKAKRLYTEKTLHHSSVARGLGSSCMVSYKMKRVWYKVQCQHFIILFLGKLPRWQENASSCWCSAGIVGHKALVMCMSCLQCSTQHVLMMSPMSECADRTMSWQTHVMSNHHSSWKALNHTNRSY